MLPKLNSVNLILDFFSSANLFKFEFNTIYNLLAQQTTKQNKNFQNNYTVFEK